VDKIVSARLATTINKLTPPYQSNAPLSAKAIVDVVNEELRINASLSSNMLRGLVFPQPDIDRVPQELVGRPGQVGDLRNKLRLDPMNARKNDRRAEARAAARRGA
jgi:hypothetical protein